MNAKQCTHNAKQAISNKHALYMQTGGKVHYLCVELTGDFSPFSLASDDSEPPLGECCLTMWLTDQHRQCSNRSDPQE